MTIAPTVLWRLSHQRSGLATCRYVHTADGYCELSVSTPEETHRELFESAYAALRRAMDLESSMLDSGWRECPAADTHSA